MRDLISRQAAIDALNDKFTIIGTTNAIVVQDYIRRVNNRLRDLPSAEVTLCHLDSPCEYQNTNIAMPTAEKVGKWERKWHTFLKQELPCCSACGKFEAFKRNYCPNCGARMEGEADRRIDDDPSHPFADGVMMKE